MVSRWRNQMVMMVGLCCAAAWPRPVRADQVPESGERRVEALDRALELSGLQQAQIRNITQAYQARRAQLEAQLNVLRQEENYKIKSALTPEQQAKFDQLQREAAARRPVFRRQTRGEWDGSGHWHPLRDQSEALGGAFGSGG